MNKGEQYYQEQAFKGMTQFKNDLEKVCKILNRKFKLEGLDNDQADVWVDDYHFTLTWGTQDKQSIGRTIPVIFYSLCVWYQSGYSRHHPPEPIDVTLVTSQSTGECIKRVFTAITENLVDGCLESMAYEQSTDPTEEQQIEEAIK